MPDKSSFKVEIRYEPEYTVRYLIYRILEARYNFEKESIISIL